MAFLQTLRLSLTGNRSSLAGWTSPFRGSGLHRRHTMHGRMRWALAAFLCGVALTVASKAGAAEGDAKTKSITYVVDGMT